MIWQRKTILDPNISACCFCNQTFPERFLCLIMVVCKLLYVCVWDPQRCRMSVFCPGVRWQSPCESVPESWGTGEGWDDKTTWEEKKKREQPYTMMQCETIRLSCTSCVCLTPVKWKKCLVYYWEHTCRWTAGCRHQSGDVVPGCSSWKLVSGTPWSKHTHTGRGCWQSTPSSGE